MTTPIRGATDSEPDSTRAAFDENFGKQFLQLIQGAVRAVGAGSEVHISQTLIANGGALVGGIDGGSRLVDMAVDLRLDLDCWMGPYLTAEMSGGAKGFHETLMIHTAYNDISKIPDDVNQQSPSNNAAINEEGIQAPHSFVPKRGRDRPVKDKDIFTGSKNSLWENDGINRRHLWHQMKDLDSKIGNLPWILGGDFNITLRLNESFDYELLCPTSTPEMKEFQDLTQDLDLHDHPFIGPLFTWSNKQSESYLARKLDRVLINPIWALSFHNFHVEFLSPGVSDHFEQSLQSPFHENPMMILFLKLKHLKTSLKNLNKSCYSEISSRHSHLLPAFNATIIALIPKIPNPCKVKDFRPISCCSVIYKVITKILVKRMTSLMPEMVSLNQSTFIKGRSIVDNTLIAQEVVKGYRRKNISPRCTMKINLQKAFDTLHWNFIISVLKVLDLPQRFIGWIQACFTEARFSISFNGSLVGFFKGERGIRQGLNLNAAKCVFFTAGVENRTVEKIKQFSGFSIGCFPVRYLGIPLITRKLSIKDCDQLIDYIKSKLNLWSGKMLSFVGRLELIRAVLFSVSNFWCRQLLLPQAVINKIDQLFSRFFWKGSDKAATGVRVSWEKICQLKSEGGL
ncbi:uncharacterized protein LOC120201026 [Hibiscus syriacus]|uniref:uncharacterized protein LOC120201026 n=1 Tax=Hibiscus syriacus TaxID=106335 RepID=UPI001922A7E2|nr:uncharacterized protein LOC120201026 [Hibiscus syriacus]